MNIIDKRASNPAAALGGTELVYIAQLGADAVTTVSDMQTFITNGFLLITTAASTYQTLSGMSSYLTTAAAASTYQTTSGMSSYLTTATAASTYLSIANSRYQFVSNAGTTYTVPASAITANGNTIIELSNNSLTSITVNTSTATGKTAGDSVTIQITGTYAAQLLVASGVTLNGTLEFSANAKIKTLIYRGSNVWTVLGG